MSAKQSKRLSEKEVELTGKRYCTGCQWTQPADEGEMRGSRWVCGKCVERRLSGKVSNTIKRRGYR